MAKRVGRIRDVARESGLSIATVSRVMNGTKFVAPETRERVLAACQKLDYLPNPAARALSTSITKTVAAVIPTIEHNIYAKYITAVEQTLSLHKYSLVLAISNADENEELTAVRKLLGMGAEAFILTGAAHSDELVDLLNRRGVAHVFASVWDPELPSPTIGYDNFAIAAEAVRFLTGKGHHRIAVVHGAMSESDRTRQRRAGADSVDLPGLAVEFFETPLNVAGGKAALRRLIESETRFTAILCLSDVLALGCYFAAAEAGLTIPDDLSVMGFDNLDWSSELYPALTTINLPARRMGRLAATHVVAHLETGAAIEPLLLEGQFIERDSVREI